MAQDGLAQTLRSLLLATQARRGTLDMQRPAAGPASARGFESLSERAPIPDDVRAYVAKQTGAAPAQPSPAQDVELFRAQDADALNDVFSRAGQGFDDAGRVIAGLPQSITRNAVGGDASVSALLQRRGGDARQQEAARRAALSDPRSPESARFRARIAKVLPGLLDDATLADVTAADEESLLKYGSLKQGREEREAARKAAEAARAESNADRDAARKQRAQEHAASLADRQAGRHDAAANRALQRELAEKERTRRGEEKRGAGTTIPGYEVTEEAAPTAEDAKKVKASLASAERIKRYVQELRALHAQHGTEYGGAVGTRMGQLGTQITLEAKNIGELGALSGPDEAIINRLTATDPSSLGANAAALVGVDNTRTALDGLDKWVEETVGANAQTYGYRKAPGAPRGGDVTPAAPEDSAAVQWARAHPEDPRAAEILRLNGAE